jgi:hypothetical protein
VVVLGLMRGVEVWVHRVDIDRPEKAIMKEHYVLFPANP